MKGLQLAKAFYEEYGKPMLEEQFKDKLNRLAIGLVGHGSECFGYDDEISIDHDYEPGFCIWLDEEDDKEFGFKLFRAYQKLPKEYKDIKLQETSALGSKYKGVHTIQEFYSFYLGSKQLPTSLQQWLYIEDFYLAEATNGEIFSDSLGKFTNIRNQILNNRPNDVRLKKLANYLFNMAQAGQYNYFRSYKHNELLASANFLNIFVNSCAKAIYLINNKYAPYDKWLYKGLKQLPILGNIYDDLYMLMSNPYDVESNITIVEKIADQIIKQLIISESINENGNYLEPYAYMINDKIKDNNLRNSSIII